MAKLFYLAALCGGVYAVAWMTKLMHSAGIEFTSGALVATIFWHIVHRLQYGKWWEP